MPACNIRDRAAMECAREAGTTQFVASAALSSCERIAALKRTADEVGIGVELLIHSNRCGVLASTAIGRDGLPHEPSGELDPKVA